MSTLDENVNPKLRWWDIVKVVAFMESYNHVDTGTINIFPEITVWFDNVSSLSYRDRVYK